MDFIRLVLALWMFALPAKLMAQAPSLKIIQPTKLMNATKSSKQFIAGRTCPECVVTVNDIPVKVYTTGTFAHQVELVPGTNVFKVRATSGNRVSEQSVVFEYTLPLVTVAVSTPTIESIQTFPEGDLVLKPGDRIYFEVKAFPGGIVRMRDVVLHEQPVDDFVPIPGIYKGTYTVKEADTLNGKLTVTLTLNDGTVISLKTAAGFSILSDYASDALMSQGRLAHLKFGWGEDRLGGAKIGYVDSLIPMRIVGKYGNDYKVELAAGKTAFIEEKYITLLPRGFILPPVLTSKITVQGDSLFDYIKMALPRRLPYESRQLLQPAAIEIDLYGAVNNTNWITQLASAKEVERVEYRQVSDEVFRITVYLNHQQHWGHSIYYENNTLVVRIKHQPNPEIKNLIIAIDAGHGGRNTGAQGLTGAIEKNICLDIALKLQKQLEEHGAKVIMTRTTERFFDNLERILFYRDSLPDLLISIHLNGSADPVNASGTMMFYRYPGFKSLNEAIYKRMQELGLKPNGITSSFNFMLNSPTEYPNALVEALFLSNPADEERVLQEAFREEMAKKIVAGIKDFLESCRKE